MSISANPVIARVTELVAPIAADLGLEIYDIEQRGGTMRVTLDTPAGSPGGVDLDTLALATRLVSRELDHHDPIPGRYTLEVTSPGVERALRTPAHFQREIGKTVAVRLRDAQGDARRVEGVLIAADDATATLAVTDPATGMPVDTVVALDQVDRARTVFVWGPAPKPGSAKSGSAKGRTPSGRSGSAPTQNTETTQNKETP